MVNRTGKLVASPTEAQYKQMQNTITPNKGPNNENKKSAYSNKRIDSAQRSGSNSTKKTGSKTLSK